MNELAKVDPKEFGLEESKATELTKGLMVILEEREVLKKTYIETVGLEITEENIPIFKELRLKIRDNRTKGIEPWHKVNKQFFLTGGRFVDAIKNKEILENELMETKLMEAEKHFENLEKERVANLEAERVELCKPWVEDESLILPDLGAMPVSLWDNYIVGLKSSYEAKVAADKKAEEERIAKEKAEEAEREAQRQENIKLKKEAEEREKQIKLDEAKRAKEEAKKQAKLNEERKETEEKQRKEKELYKAKLEEQRKENERIEREEKQKREKLEAELKAKEDAERKVKEDEEERFQAELNKGDEAKIKDLIADLMLLKKKYSFKSDKNKKMYKDTGLLIDKIITHIE